MVFLIESAGLCMDGSEGTTGIPGLALIETAAKHRDYQDSLRMRRQGRALGTNTLRIAQHLAPRRQAYKSLQTPLHSSDSL